jgi:hypothetical protein
MSIRMMSAVWDLDLPDSEKLIMLALADWADDDGRCWPSIAQIVKRSSKSERTVQAALKSLEAKGALVRAMKPGCGTKYTLNPRSHRTPADTAPPQGTTKTPAAAAPNTSRTIIGSTDVLPPPTPQKPKPAVASGKPAGKPVKADAVPMPDLPDWVPPDAWAGFLANREHLKKPMTPHAAVLIFSKLKALSLAGHPPGDVLNQSTMCGWQGVFKLKGDFDDGRNGQRSGAGAGRAGPRDRDDGDYRNPLARAAAQDARDSIQ